MKKKTIVSFLLLFCIMASVLMVSGCSLVPENKSFNKKNLKEQTDAFIESWFAADFNEMIEAYQSQMDEATLKQYKEYAKQKEKYKSVEKTLKTEYTINNDSATVTETVLCGNGEKLLISLSFDETGNIQANENGTYAFKFEEYKSLGQKMGKAALNTVLSMAIVFAVLIFIAAIIHCFTLIGKWQSNTAQENTPAPRTAAAPAAAVNLTDDLELVAVITAAIAAAEETESADGLIVRSIIRR